MLGRYKDVLDIYSSISLHMIRLIKPHLNISTNTGNNQNNNNNNNQNNNNSNSATITLHNSIIKLTSINQFQKLFDKILLLTAVCNVGVPDYKLDSQINEIIVNKYSDKIQRLKNYDPAIYREVFDSSFPKFISISLSSASTSNLAISSNDVRFTQCEIFTNNLKQQQYDSIFTQRYLSLYSVLSLQKLTYFINSNKLQLLSYLIALKLKNYRQKNIQTNITLLDCNNNTSRTMNTFEIKNDNLIVHENLSSSNSNDQFFISGMQKNSELTSEVNKIFSTFNRK